MMTLLVYEPLEPPRKNIKSKQQGVRMSHHQPSPGLWCLAGARWALARAEGQKATVHHTDPQTHHHCHTEAAHAGRRHGGHSGENFNVNGALPFLVSTLGGGDCWSKCLNSMREVSMLEAVPQLCILATLLAFKNGVAKCQRRGGLTKIPYGLWYSKPPMENCPLISMYK